MNAVTSLTVFHAKEAIDYYIDVFNASLIGNLVMMEDMPGYEDSIHKGLVAHSQLKFGDTTFFINDQLGDHIQEVGRHIQICLNVYGEDEFKSIYNKVKEKSVIEREIETEYWGADSFSLKDPFDIVWHVFYIKEEAK